MAPVAVDLIERRRECRHVGGGPWEAATLIRPGQRVTLINICSRAALLESAARLRPGAQTEMQLAGAACARQRERTPRPLLRCGARANPVSRRVDFRSVRRRRGDRERRIRVVGAFTSFPHGHLLLISESQRAAVRVDFGRDFRVEAGSPVGTPFGIDLIRYERWPKHHARYP